jgi:hypothetical protein
MSLKFSHTPKLTAFVIIVTIIMFVPIFMVPQPARSQAFATGNALREVHLRMTADGLSPITPKEDQTVRKKSVPNGFQSGRVSIFGQVVFKHMGIWELDKIADVITIQQPVKFIIWLSTSGTTSGDIRFTLKYGTLVVAGPTVLQARSIAAKAKRYEVSSHANLTTTDSGKPLQLEVEAKINGNGVMIEFGGYQEDSGVSFMCDAIKFKAFHAEQKEFCVEFSDAFRAPVNNLHPILFVDDNAIYDEEGYIIDRGKSETGNNLFIWKLILRPGDHTFLLGISYSKNKDINLTWNTQVALHVKEEINHDSIWDRMDKGDIIVMFLLILGIVIYFISTIAVLSARSSKKNIYARKSPIPNRYKLIVKKRMTGFQKRARPVASSSGKSRTNRSFRAKKKFKM